MHDPCMAHALSREAPRRARDARCFNTDQQPCNISVRKLLTTAHGRLQAHARTLKQMQ